MRLCAFLGGSFLSAELAGNLLQNQQSLGAGTELRWAAWGQHRGRGRDRGRGRGRKRDKEELETGAGDWSLTGARLELRGDEG